MATGRVPTTANSPLTAKGDLFGYSTTQARVPVGSDGETLVADSSASTGLRWQQTQGKNICYNSAFDIWQRGTSFTTTGATNQYSADRWQIFSGTGQKTFTRQTAGSLGTTPAQTAQYCVRMQRDSGSTANDAMYLMQSLENADSAPYVGKTITLSFYARKGANYSATSSEFIAQIVTGTGTDQNQLNFTGYAVVATNNIALTSSWVRYSVTVTLSTSITQIGWRLWWTPSGTAGAADYAEVAAVQVEVGSVPTNYNRMTGTLAGEFQAAQRYCYVYSSGTMGAEIRSSTQGFAFMKLPTTMRTSPVVTYAAAGSYSLNSAGKSGTLTSVATDTASPDFLSITLGFTGYTAGQAGTFFTSGSTIISAEL